MQVTNIRSHRIRWRLLLAQGALAGIVSAVVMLVIAVALYPLFTNGADIWSFAKVVGSVVYGSSAVDPLSGFEAGPVLVGLLLHFALGAFAGMTYAALVAMFDLEGWTPVALFGLLYGAMLFVWSTTLIEAGLTRVSTEQFQVLAMFWGNLAFGLTSGVLLANWADDADLDQYDDERVPVFEGQLDQHRLLH
jgi:hypothetical protein